jgi:phage baseplate assembly protein W
MSALIFPISINANGSSELATSNKDSIQQNVKAILGTQQGGYGFDRAFGSRLNELTFEPNNEVLITLMTSFIKTALKQEKRIQVQRIFFEVDTSIVKSRIIYTIIQSNSTEELIYDFQRL